MEIHVDDVVVCDRDTTQRVGDGERPRLITRVEVPDDPRAVRAPFDAEGSRGPGPSLERGLVTTLERNAALGDGRVDERLAVAKRYVAISEREVPRECDLEPFADPERAVVLDVDRDVCREQREAVSARRIRQSEDSGRDDGRER